MVLRNFPDPSAINSFYGATFTVGILAVGFDIRQAGYAETVSANATVRPIPWSPTYTVIVQFGLNSLQPIARTYRAIVWSETDYGALRSVVGQQGTLTTPREGGPQLAYLNNLKRSDLQDQTDAQGPISVDLEFTMYVTG